jgi:hypothetical protein
MNVEKVKALREALATGLLARQGVGFNMCTEYATDVEARQLEDYSGYNCGTVACLAGSTVLLEPNGRELIRDESVLILSHAKNLLGLHEAEGEDLFCPFGYSDQPANFTLERAVKVLDVCISEGRVPSNVWDEEIRDECA